MSNTAGRGVFLHVIEQVYILHPSSRTLSSCKSILLVQYIFNKPSTVFRSKRNLPYVLDWPIVWHHMYRTVAMN